VNRVALLGATLIGLAGPLAAQRASLLAGGVRAEYADSISGTAGFVSGRLSGSSSRAAGTIDAGFSQFTSGEWVTQLGASGSAIQPLSRNIIVGLRAVGFANTFKGGAWTGGGSAGPVFAVAPGSLLATMSVTGGQVRRTDEASLTVGTADARIRLSPSAGLSFDAGISGTTADTLRYVDAALGVTFRRPKILLAASAGARAGDLADDPWGHVRMELALTPATIVEAAVGRYPQDLAGFTKGEFATLGLRVNLTRAARADWTAQPAPPLRVERTSGQSVRIIITLEDDVEVLELVGEWNSWTPVTMTRETTERWSIEQQLAPGVYHYALLVDGDDWTVPPGAPAVPDEFGGQVGILIVR
jgi:hypothetical protein